MVFNKLIMLAIFMLLIKLTVGQTTYTHTPTSFPSSACTSGNLTNTPCGLTFNGSVLQLRGSTGSQLSLTMAKCNGSSFYSNVDYYIKWSSNSDPKVVACSNDFVQIYPSSTSYTYVNSNPGFTSGTRYYMFIMRSGDFRWYSNIVTVTATASIIPPTASTNDATLITSNSSRLNGSVNPNGTLTGYNFEYGTSTSYGSNTTVVSVGSGTSTQNVYADISGLSPNTTYHFRIKAANSAGQISYGSNKSFTTNPAGQPPTVTTGAATNITSNSAILNGTVNPNGAATAYLFEYGTSTSYGNSTNAVNIGSGTTVQSVSATISGLQANTTYHYRIYAGNTYGYSPGNNVSFTTAAPAISYFYSPPINQFTVCGNGITNLGSLDYINCSSLPGTTNYIDDNVNVSLILHNTTTGTITFRISKCSGYFVNNTSGKLFIRQGPDVWCSDYSITNSTTSFKDITINYSPTFSGLRQFEAFLITSNQVTKLFAGFVSVTGSNPNFYINITNPTAGITWQTGSAYNLQWNDNISENVRITLSKGGAFITTIVNSTPSNGNYSWVPSATLETGSNYEITIRSVDNSTISASTGYFTIIGQTSNNCSFTDCSSSINCGGTTYQEETFLAVQYLCQNNIVSGVNGNALPNENITRAALAKIALFGLFGDSLNVPSALVSDYFPSPYADLQNPATYYYRAAKALLYLQFNDHITPFDRDRLNFFPNAHIERVLVLKVLLEAFNIPPATEGSNPFSDFPSSAQHWGYAKKAWDLGITTETLFRPYDYATRAEAFIFLYRIMTTVSLPTVNNTLIPTSSSFFIPSNVSIAGMAASLGIESGNFDHYTKSCFTIPGRNHSLDFDFSYNSYLTEMPAEVYPIEPLGKAWSHSYNMYINIIAGATSDGDKLILHMPDGSLLVYQKSGSNFVPETKGNYNTLTEISSNEYQLLTNNQVAYKFQRWSSNDIAFMLTEIKDRNNNALTITYQQGIDYTIPGTTITRTARRIFRVTDPAGRQLNFSYLSGTNLLSSVTDPLSRLIAFTYSNGQLIKYTDAKGLQTNYNYGGTELEKSLNLLRTITLPKGNVITNEYQQRKLTSTKFNNNSPTTIAHNPNYIAGNNNFYMSTVSVPQQGSQSIVTNYELNKYGNMTKATGNPAININTAYSNINHPTLPSGITNNLNNVTVTPIYDNQGNVTQITTSGSGLNLVETFQYNSLNDITHHTDARGNTTQYFYTNGNLTKVRDALNNETNIANNSYGQPTSLTNPSGVTVNFGYNSYGNQNSVSIPSLGLNSSMAYDAVSRMTSATNFNGQTSTYTYDNNDNLLSEVNALNHNTTYAYDANDNLTSITNAKGFATTFVYDFNTDWLLSESFQGAVKEYTYNQDGTLNTFKNPNGIIRNYAYDIAGRVTSDGYATYTYLSNGNLSSVSRSGKAITYTYDALNRITAITYDGNTVNYTYDNNGNVLTMKYPGNKTVNYTYDVLNRMKTVTDWNSQTTTYNYRPDGQLDNMVYPNQVKTSYVYDNAGRPTGISTKRNNGNGSSIVEYGFVLDALGNHTQESILEQFTSYPPLPNQTINYTYTNANRIQTAGGINFGFDNNGNTISKTGKTYSYDALNNLTAISGSFNASYAYDGAGHRRQATRNGVVTNYVMDILGIGNVLLETNSVGTPQNYYVYGLGLISRIKPDNTTHYYVYDYRGSAVAMVDAAANAYVTHKYQYDEFGNILQVEEADFNPFRYVGRYGVMYEAEDLQFMRARHYDPEIGRFLSEDPIWSTNLYPYADNNPFGNIDPSGKSPLDISIEFNMFVAGQERKGIKFEEISNRAWATFCAQIVRKYSGYAIPVNTISTMFSTKYKNYSSKDLGNLIMSFTKDAANWLSLITQIPGISTAAEEASRGYGMLFDYFENIYLEKRYKVTEKEIKYNEARIKFYEYKMNSLKQKR